jgi:hypothetical protein
MGSKQWRLLTLGMGINYLVSDESRIWPQMASVRHHQKSGMSPDRGNGGWWLWVAGINYGQRKLAAFVH